MCELSLPSMTLSNDMPPLFGCRTPEVARAFVGVCLLLALSACANIQRRIPEVTAPARIEALQPMDIAGRISLRQGKEGHSGGVRWFFDPPRHDIRVLTPLGQTVARIVEDVNGVTLTTDTESVRARDPDALVERVLGWPLPLKGLQHWVLGLASPASRAQTETDGASRVSRITQDDWEIVYANYRRVQGTQLPGRIVMRRGDIEVRLVVDSWKPVLQSQ
jgi:outer membrane lipoprotein LolB